jgi:integrase
VVRWGVLNLYRRHYAPCPHTKRRYRRCACPIWVEGTLRGEKIRKSLDLTSWEAASDLVAAWSASEQIGVVKPDVPTVQEAVSKFFEDAVARGLRDSTTNKLKNVLEKRLLPWCETKGYRLLKQLDVDALRRFRATWPDGALAASKNLERLRSFFRFALDAGWVAANPAKAIKPPQMDNVSDRVKVFTAADIKKILAACDKYPRQNSYGRDNPERVRAFVLTLRYSGLRIGDCVGLKRDHLRGDKLFLRTQKSGTPVYIPLPKDVVDALHGIGNSGDHFFWTGNGLRKSAVSDWQRSLRRVFGEADVKGNPHMFRHSLATELLGKGVPLETVAVLLGHSSPAITNKYYSHWVKARQESLEAAVRKAW